MFWKGRLSTISFLVASTLLLPRLAHAECFVMNAKAVMSEDWAELLFSGRVVEIIRSAPSGYRATFDVDRVWKGTVAHRIDLYVSEIASEMPLFGVRNRYIVVANRLVDQIARESVGLGPSEPMAFAPAQCSGSWGADFENQLGLGYRPKDP
jgi:hypothetical protein